MKTTILGIGLIGASLARSLRDCGLSSDITGFDASPSNCDTALEMGIVDRIASFDEAIAGAELIIIATPVDIIPSMAVKVLNKITDKQVVMDVGSIKGELAEMIEMHARRSSFVATHPMWGTENSGPQASVKGAFTGRTAVICDRELSGEHALNVVENIYNTIGMPISYMSSEEQDTHSAYISHISHISAYALALTVLEKEREESRIFELASGGFESTVRLAKSSPSMWTPIFLGNKYNVLDVLREHIHQLQVLRRMIERDDRQGLSQMIEKANTVKQYLKN